MSDRNPVRFAPGAEPFVEEIAADEPLGHWRGGGALGGVEASDTLELTVELWGRFTPGMLAAYREPAGRQGRGFEVRLDEDRQVVVRSVHDDAVATGVALDGARHQLVVQAEGIRGSLRLFVDGEPRFDGSVVRDWTLLGGGTLEAGEVDELAWFERALPASRVLGHARVMHGALPPTRVDATLPLRFCRRGGHADFVTQIAFAPDGARLVSVDVAGRAAVWDVRAGVPLRELDWPARARARFSRDARHLLATGWRDREASAAWDVQTGEARDPASLPAEPPPPTPTLRAVPTDGGVSLRDADDQEQAAIELPGRSVRDTACAPDGSFAVIRHTEYVHPDEDFGPLEATLDIHDASTGALRHRHDGGVLASSSWQLSPDGRFVVVEHVDVIDFETSDYVLWDTGSGEILRGLHSQSEFVSAVAFSDDGGLIACGGSDGDLALHDGEGVPVLLVPGRARGAARGLAFADDDRRLQVADAEGRLHHIELATLKQVDVTPGGRLDDDEATTADGALRATVERDGTVALTRAAGPADDDGGPATVRLAFQAGDWLAWTDDGLFDASPGGAWLMAAARGTQVFAVEQLAASHNRPDRMLARMGLGSPAQRAALEQAWRHRVRQLGGATTLDDLPRARILRATPSSADWLELDCELRDPHGLARYQIHVDGVGLYPDGGKAVTGRRVRLDEAVLLTHTSRKLHELDDEGINRVELSAWNIRGQESLRALVFARCPRRPDAPSGDLLVVAFGVSRYRDDAIADLRWAHRDVRDLGALLARGHRRFGATRVHAWTDEQVTADRVRDAHALFDGTFPRDTAVLFVSGHGVYDDRGRWFYLTHDAELDRLAETAVDFETVEGLLDAIPARRKLLLMDTCQSGELFDAAPPPVDVDGGGKGLVARVLPGGIHARPGRPLDDGDPPPPRRWLLERDRFVHRDVRRRTGAIVLSSSLGAEASWESDELANGAFTEALLEVLGDDPRPVDNLIDHRGLLDRVRERVRSLTGDRQHPTIDRDNLRQSVEMPVYARRPDGGD